MSIVTVIVYIIMEHCHYKMRCEWSKRESMHDYHDKEWGVPVHNDRKLFEFLILEGAQAGLTWETVLKRRKGYKRVFHKFNFGIRCF